MSLITGTELDDTLGGTSDDDTIQGLDGADSLNGLDGRDQLFGGAGDDRLNGGDLTGSIGVSDDTLDGGPGNDVLFGRRGNDDYIFSAGFGQDEILDNSAASNERDRIIFDATIDRADIRLTTVFDLDATSDLLIVSDADGSTILLDDFIVGSNLENGLREVVFDDGTTLNLDQGLVLTGGDAADTMAGADTADTLAGNGGDDHLNGMGGADLLVGGAGDDTLTGGNRSGLNDLSDDTLIGGAGNDLLTGRQGDDDLIFSAGFGNDVVQDNNALADDRDRIIFDATIDRADILITTVFDQNSISDLLLTSVADGSSIFLDEFISGGDLENGVREIVFADGTVLALDAGLQLNGGDGADDMGAADQADTLDGGGGDDRLNGMGGADLLIGGAGDDTLSGGNRLNFADSSNDTLVGGTGNDQLIGRGGDDDFLFSAGFGQDEIQDNSTTETDRDRIVFDATIDRADILITTVFDQISTSDLLLTSVTDGSSIFLDDFIFSDDLGNGVREVVFADGTVLALDAGLQLNGGDGADDMGSADQADTLDGGGGDDRLNGMGGADLLIGGAGDDTLSGGNRLNFADSSNDTLIGGTGNDRLIGRGGDDDFVFSAGFGQDEIQDNSAAETDRDRIVFDATIDRADVQIRTVNTVGNVSGDLVLEHLIDGSTITVTGLVDGGRLGNGIRLVAFADGTTIDLEQGYTQDGTAGDDTLIGLGGADVLRGLGGDDLLNGVFGADQLFGGAGQDTLDGGAVVGATDSSDDILTGGAGDDRLTGRGGNDTFVFSDGDGNDTVTDFTVSDLIDLTGVTAIAEIDDVFALVRDIGVDTLIEIGAGDSITLENFSASDLVAGNFIINADNANLIVGTDGDDLLIGDSLNNTIDGLGGNDTIDGALGDDLLDGGTGNDTYLFSAGFGNDRIIASDAGAGEENRLFFDASFNKLDIRLKSFANPDDLGASLVIRHDQGNGEITVNDFYNATPGAGFGALRSGFEILEFADGTVIDLRDGLVLRGEAQGEHMRGTDQGDQISGASGGDELEGFGGSDSLFGGLGGDTLRGGDDDDQLFGGSEDDRLEGGDGQDLANGDTGDDTVLGGDGADTLLGGAGDDLLIGEAGDDTYLFSIGFGTDTVSEVRATAADNDRILFDNSLSSSDIRLTSEASAGGFANLALVDDRDGSIIRAINFIDLDGSFQDGLRFIAFDDGTTIDLDGGLDLQGVGVDERIGGSAADDTISGGAGNDTLEGRGGANLLQGDAGNDSLIGAGGGDTLDGGSGDDVLQGNGGDDVLIVTSQGGADTAVGFTDGDRIDVTQVAIIADLDDALSLLTQQGNDAVLDLGEGNSLTLTNLAISALDENAFIFDPDNTGGGGGGNGDDESLTGDENANLLEGGDGDDTLSGLGGNDTLVGGADDDLLQGGADSDTYRFGAGFGTDEITAEGALAGDADRIFFDASVDRADIRITTEGFARLFANLTIVSDADGSVVRHRDFVQLDGQFLDGVRFIEFADGTLIDLSLGLDLQGGEGVERMRGSAIADTIRGGGGDDQLEGGDGDDLIIGQAGDDLLIGEGGNDTYVIGLDTGSDVISEIGAGTGDQDRILFEAGINPADIRLTTVQQSDGTAHLEIHSGSALLARELNFIQADGNLQNGLRLIAFDDGTEIDLAQGLTIEGSGDNDLLVGTSGADTLLGLGGDDTLEGGAGNDELSGAGGEDTYVFGAGFGADEVLILGASGLEADRLFFDASIDRADIRLFSVADPFDLSADLFIQDDADGSTVLVSDFYNPNRGGSFGQLRSGFEILEFADGTTIDLRQGFDLVGDDGADHMRGPNLNDRLFGLAGADTLEGRNGNDSLFGGDDADDLQGGSGNDELFGGADDDFLFGEGDADTLEGGLGDDTLIGAGGNDTYVFSAGFGADEVLTLDASGLEQDRLLFDASIDRADIRLFSVADPFDLSADLFIRNDADGSNILIADFYNPNPGGSFGQLRAGFELLEFADGTIVELRQGLELVGGDGADFMRGPDRDDQLLGLGGDDTLEGHIGDDSLFGGDGHDALLGSSGNDLISGDAGDDSLSGEAGDDTLDGGAGADSLAGGSGDDLFVLEAGDGADRIADFAAGTLSEDRLDISALGFTRFQDVLDAATDGAEGVVLALGSGTSVLLEDVLAADLDADDFILASGNSGPAQRIDPAVDAFIVGDGDQIAVTGVYATADPVDETLTGIGIRVHFDSSVLQFDGLENVFQPALQPFGQIVEADSGDFDDDATTDSFVALNWADFGGQFPGVGTTPLDLFDILFTGRGSATDSSVNFSASSVALDRTFASTSVDIAADRWPLPDTVTVAENSADGTLVADLAPIPIDAADPGSFTLLDDAAGRFVLDGFVLRVADGDALDFEGDASHDLSIRITNNAGGSMDRAITVNLTDVNEAPTAVAIDGDNIDEDAEAGDQVGTLSALDPEGDIISFSLTDDAGGRFALDGDRLVVAGGGLDFETAPGHSITVRATDTGGLSLDQVLDITVNDVAEATLDLDGDGQVNALTDGLIALGDLFGAPLSQLAGLAEPGSPGTDTLVLGDLLDQARAEIFDVDGDGNADALTDGLMILGHLFGAPPDQVAAFAQPGALRSDPAEIAQFLDSFVPVEA
ncbi:MAG: hypothetical protein P1U37_02870 [Minwuia sp.]|nr:hypothetical protein [Minwuia sp.]